jgi:hypothetical protein
MEIKCSCIHCGGHITFDAGGFMAGDNCALNCPHCQKEIVVTINSPLPPVLPPPQPLDPISSSEQMPKVEMRLSSGASFRVVAVRLYEEAAIEELKTKSSDAILWLESAAQGDSLEAKKELQKLSSSGRTVQQNIRPWDVTPTYASAIIGILEPISAKKSYATAMQLFKEVKEGERNLRQSGILFHISRIEKMNIAMPGYWRAVFNSKTYVHDGLDFVTIQDEKQNDFSIRWSAVEYFNCWVTK